LSKIVAQVFHSSKKNDAVMLMEDFQKSLWAPSIGKLRAFRGTYHRKT